MKTFSKCYTCLNRKLMEGVFKYKWGITKDYLYIKKETPVRTYYLSLVTWTWWQIILHFICFAELSSCHINLIFFFNFCFCLKHTFVLINFIQPPLLSINISNQIKISIQDVAIFSTTKCTADFYRQLIRLIEEFSTILYLILEVW